jgi:hypothetical protein
MKAILNKQMNWKDGSSFPIKAECDVIFDQSNIAQICYSGDIKRMHVTKLYLYFSEFEKPSIEELMEQSNDGICQSICGERVEPDGYDEYGSPSWLLAMGCI